MSGNADRLTQAVWNLVRNAIEAGAANVSLRTRVERGMRIGDVAHAHARALRLEIADHGRGVPEALAEQVFLPLVSGRADGTGLHGAPDSHHPAHGSHCIRFHPHGMRGREALHRN